MKDVSFAAPIIAAAMIWAVPVAAAAATVRDARVAVVFSPDACDVTSYLVVDTAEPVVVDHRLMLDDERRPPVFAVTGALAGQAETIGRTASLRISLTGAGRNEYMVRYQVDSPAARIEKCPLLMAGGFAACLAWTLTLQRSFASHGIDAVEVGVATSAVLFVVVSRLTPPTPASNLAVFFDGATHARSDHPPVL